MKYWGLFFGLISILAIAVFVYAPFDEEWWLPGYRSTNEALLTALETLQEESGEGAMLLDSFDLDVSESDDPAGMIEPLTNLHDQLDRSSIRVRQLLTNGILTDRLRSLESELAQARGTLESAENSVLNGDLESAQHSLTSASGSLLSVAEISGSTLGAITGPDGNLREPISSAAGHVDHLFVVLLVITGLTFAGTMAVLAVAAWRYAAREGRRATYTHGSVRLELIWTLIPAVILIFISFYQLGAWSEIKFQGSWPDVPPVAEVKARQFQWKIRYPGPDKTLYTADDLHTINELHVVKGDFAMIHLTSEDVLHSFFLPQLRIKQDAVPGMTIPVLFDANKPGRYELLCAELCGWGHSKMRAILTVHETRSEFEEWMEEAIREQNRDTPDEPSVDVAAAPGTREE